MSDRRPAHPDDRRGPSGSGPDRDYTEFGFKGLDRFDELHEALDGTLDRSDVRFRSRFMGDRRFREELSAMESMLAPLSKPARGPDLSARILARVGQQKSFVPRRVLRLVSAGRLAAAACVLLAVGAAVAVEYARPGTFEFGGSRRAVSMVVEAASADVRSGPSLASRLDLSKSVMLPAAERGEYHAVSFEVRPSRGADADKDTLKGDFETPLPVDRIERVWVPTLGKPSLDGSAKTVIRNASWRPQRP